MVPGEGEGPTQVLTQLPSLLADLVSVTIVPTTLLTFHPNAPASRPLCLMLSWTWPHPPALFPASQPFPAPSLLSSGAWAAWDRPGHPQLITLAKPFFTTGANVQVPGLG